MLFSKKTTSNPVRLIGQGSGIGTVFISCWGPGSREKPDRSPRWFLTLGSAGGTFPRLREGRRLRTPGGTAPGARLPGCASGLVPSPGSGAGLGGVAWPVFGVPDSELLSGVLRGRQPGSGSPPGRRFGLSRVAPSTPPFSERLGTRGCRGGSCPGGAAKEDDLPLLFLE